MCCVAISRSAPLVSTPALRPAHTSVWWVDAVMGWARRRECSVGLTLMQSFAIQGLRCLRTTSKQAPCGESPVRIYFWCVAPTLRKTITAQRVSWFSPRRVSGRKNVAGKATAAVHFWLRRASKTPAFRPIATTMGLQTRHKLASKRPPFASTPSAKRAPGSPVQQNHCMKSRLFPPCIVAPPCRTGSAAAGLRLVQRVTLHWPGEKIHRFHLAMLLVKRSTSLQLIARLVRFFPYTAFARVLARTTSSTASERGGTLAPAMVRNNASTSSTPATAMGWRTVVSGGLEWLAHSMSS